MERGEIVWVKLPYKDGVEIREDHPFIVIQNDTGNKHSQSIIGVAISSKPKKPLPVHIDIPKEELSAIEDAVDSVVKCEHIYTIDKKRVRRRTSKKVSTEMMQRIEAGIKTSLGL